MKDAKYKLCAELIKKKKNHCSLNYVTFVYSKRKLNLGNNQYFITNFQNQRIWGTEDCGA